MKNNEKQPIRSLENTKMTISLPVNLLDQIDLAAEKSRRNRSQFLVIELEKIVAEHIASQIDSTPPRPLRTVRRSPKAKRSNTRQD